MVQSMGILRHVARKHGLYGKNNAEMARVEEARALAHCCPMLSSLRLLARLLFPGSRRLTCCCSSLPVIAAVGFKTSTTMCRSLRAAMISWGSLSWSA